MAPGKASGSRQFKRYVLLEDDHGTSHPPNKEKQLKMLKVPLTLSLLLTAAMQANGQNLVPNPSFEDTALCDSWNLLYTQAPPWFNPNTATPDIYDCDLTRQCGVVWDPADPDVQASGWQYANTGTRFAGAYHWFGPGGSNTKDYLSVRLLDTLLAGMAYRTAVHYSRADGFLWAVDRISMYFSHDSLHEDHPGHLPYTPQVDLMDPGNAYLAEATAWVELADTFVAGGGERFLTIGSFLDSSQVNGSMTTGTWNYGYYYYDDVEVVLLGPVTGMHDPFTVHVEWPWIVYWWSGVDPLRRVSILDQLGRSVYVAEIVSASGRLMIPDLPSGIYLVVEEGASTRRVVRMIGWAGP